MCITVRVKIVSEVKYKLPKNRMVPKCPVCSLSVVRRKRDAAFADSQEMSQSRVEGIKMHCCLLFCQGRIFNPTNLLNNAVPSIELMMQM